MKALTVWIIFVAALLGEGWIMDNTKIKDRHLNAATLANAIEDQRAVVDYMQERQEVLSRCRMQAQSVGNGVVCKGFEQKQVETAGVLFQSMRVLGLLRELEEQAAGRVA